MRYHWSLLIVVAAAVGCQGVQHGVPGAGVGTYGAPPAYNLPPAQMLMEPGPGVGGPGPGVMMPPPAFPTMPRTSQVAFVGPDGMMVNWDVTAPGRFDSEGLITPGRYNFGQGAIYRLKLTNIPGRPGTELYPTLELGPTLPRTEAYISHSPIPVAFTEEDFEQVLSGNYVTKVIYLPDAEYQELAIAGLDVLVSTRLDPGVDPIVEADRRGAIMAVVRLGNIDLQAPGAPVAGMMGGEGVMPAAFFNQQFGADPAYGPTGAAGPYPMQAMPPPYLTGVTSPTWGMPMTSTPIGLPGPPHIPLGGPAGLKSHTMHNHTQVALPAPTSHMNVHVRQTPGISYPPPAANVYIHENAVPQGPPAGYCPPEGQY